MFCSVAFAHTIEWYVGDTLLSTTTCESGDNITPPTVPAKFGYSFKKWKPEYTRIEYLESTGTQWIDTGYKYTNTITAKMSINRKNSLIGRWLFGYRFTNTPAVDGNMRAFFIYEDGRIGLRFGAGASNSSVGVELNKQVELELITTERKIYLNGTPIVQAPSAYNTTDFGTIYFLWANVDGYYSADVSPFIGMVYYLQIYDNDVLVRDMIPVLDKNGTPCMYDKVEHKFYYNAGTGQFIAGPVLTE